MGGGTIMAAFLLFLSFLVLAVLLVLRGRKGEAPSVRPLAAFQDLEPETGYAAESGSAVHVALGSGEIYGEDALTSLAALQVVASLAELGISYSAPPLVTVGDPTLLPLAQDALRRAYERSGASEMYDPNCVRFVAPTPVAYAAAAAHVVALGDVTTTMMAGSFGPEVSLIADAGARHDISQLAAVAAAGAAGALYPVTERLAVGEELYAAGAQMTEKRYYSVSLAVQDILRVVVVLAIFGSALMALLGSLGM
jgi:hypothetical protein